MKPVVLVIGKGQLGQELARIHSAQLDVRIVGRETVDVTKAAEIQNALRQLQPRIVLNASGYTAVDRAETERDAAFAVNCNGAGTLASNCADLGIPLVHVSTDYVFDGEAGPYTEKSAPAPRSVYGESKLEGEKMVRSRLERHIILRTAWVFSVFGSNFVKTMLQVAGRRHEIEVVDDQFGCPTPAAALAQAMMALAAAAIEGKRLAWGTYHFAGQPSTTWCRFAERIFSQAVALGFLRQSPRVIAIAARQYPSAVRRPPNSSLNCDALSVLGLAAPDWRAGLDDVLGELKAAALKASAVQ